MAVPVQVDGSFSSGDNEAKSKVVYRLLALLLVGAGLVFGACGGGSSEDSAPSGGPVTEDDIRATMEGVLTAALNGDAAGFAAYLASSCEREEELAQSVGLLRSLLGDLAAEEEVSVRLPEVEYDIADANHVTVTGLPGLQLLVDDQPAGGGVATGVANVSLKLVREDRAWRIESCGE